jgi:hypothetical protein
MIFGGLEIVLGGKLLAAGHALAGAQALAAHHTLSSAELHFI